MASDRRVGTVAALGAAQTLAWASSYYLPAMLAMPMARELGVATPTVFAAFSLALLVSALLGPFAGRAIDRRGGRLVLVATNVVFAAGLAGLGLAQGPLGLFAAWVVLGIGMGSGLYEAAFATLVRLYGRDARGAITGITLIAGFASTVGWPLSAFLESHIGWRGACFAWAALHLLLGAPLNASLPRGTAVSGVAVTSNGETRIDDRDPIAAPSAAWLLALAFAVTWFISTAMAAHLPRLLEKSGVTLTGAVAIGALVGPAQVAGRLLEFSLLRRIHPLLSARLAALMHPLGATLLVLFGAPAAVAFALLHGAGNGILTIAKGTLPLVFFGARGYGLRQGLLTFPARIGQALAPWLFGLMLARWSADALWISAALGMTAFAALLVLPKPSP
jgi:predicted MFS family arabinose efflux permease